MKKDYNLLHPFDLEAAKRGEAICFYYGFELLPLEYIAGPDARGRICVKYPYGDFDICTPSQYYMIPLAWVEGKPVYKGDVLFHKTGVNVTAERRRDDDFEGFICTDGDYVLADNLSWIPPKVKHEGWIAVHRTNKNSPFLAYASQVYASKEEAEINHPDYTSVHIEWE